MPCERGIVVLRSRESITVILSAAKNFVAPARSLLRSEFVILSDLMQGVGWVERSEPHQLRRNSWWGSLLDPPYKKSQALRMTAISTTVIDSPILIRKSQGGSERQLPRVPL